MKRSTDVENMIWQLREELENVPSGNLYKTVIGSSYKNRCRVDLIN